MRLKTDARHPTRPADPIDNPLSQADRSTLPAGLCADQSAEGGFKPKLAAALGAVLQVRPHLGDFLDGQLPVQERMKALYGLLTG